MDPLSADEISVYRVYLTGMLESDGAICPAPGTYCGTCPVTHLCGDARWRHERIIATKQWLAENPETGPAKVVGVSDDLPRRTVVRRRLLGL